LRRVTLTRDQWSRLYMSNREKSSDKPAPRIRENSVVSALTAGVWTGAALIAIAAFIAYLPSINGGFVWDDDLLLTNNYLIKAPDGLHRFWCTTEAKDYWPATNTTFWLEWRLWGMNSTGYHVSNLILHIAEALLVWIVLRKLSIPGAFLAAMFFAVHPVNVESVAWIAQRKNTMAMLFLLLSVLWYLKAVMPTASAGMAPAPRPTFGRRPLAAKQNTAHCPLSTAHNLHWYWLSLAAFALSMLGKGSVAVLPALLLGIVWWLRPLTRWDLVRTAPFFLVAAVLSGVNVWFQTHGTGEVIRIATFAQRLLGAGCAVWFYLYKALLPIDLAPIYRQWHIETGNLLWWLPLLAAVIVTAVLWLYRESWARPLLFAWGFFCVALLPVLGFTDVLFMRYSLVADRYQHIAIIGVIALVTAGISAWLKRPRDAIQWVAIVLIIAAVVTLTFLTWRQNGNYRDEIALYKATLDNNPDSWIAHYTLAFALVQTGEPEETIKQFEKALLLHPDFPEAHNGLGAMLTRTGRPGEAIEHFRQALQSRPYYVEARINLGAALVQTGRAQEAIEQYEQVLRLRPDDDRACYNIANALAQANRLPEAIDYFKQSLRLKPDYPQANNNLGIALVKVGRLGEAAEYFQHALTLKPDYPEAHYNLGNTLFGVGRLPEAIEHYKRALKLNPDYPDALRNMGSALVATGRPADAIEYYRQSLKLEPDVYSVHYNMAVAYSQTRQSSEAVASARKAIELARSQGQSAQAKKIEDWLNSYRAGLANPPNAPPSSKSDLPQP
jgi:protein O-mannosyl-transferase